MESTKTIGYLKNAIKAKKAPELDDVAADKLTLWRASIHNASLHAPITILALDDKTELANPRTRLSILFPESPDDSTYIIVQRPSPGDLRVRIKNISDKFFERGSIHANFLDAYVRGELKLKVTTTGIRGLPIVLRRGVVETSFDSGPSLLFMDLPDPPLDASDSVPEHFKSNILLNVLENMQAQDLPVFGVSGCGKTRTMLEVLCLQWGFYFNASRTDVGSDDLYRLGEIIGSRITENTVADNTIFAKKMTMLLFLSRLLILRYCLRVQGCRQTFSSPRWALLQVCPNMFKDIFQELFSKLYDQMKEHPFFGSALASIVREEFVLVREILAAHDYPNFSSESKLRLVIDEAQILSDKTPVSFESTFSRSNRQPMLSPVLHGFRTTGDRGELTIIYSGTGLSIQTLHWAMSSGDGIKEYGLNAFPYIEFPGWTDRDSVQAYVDRIKEQLLDDESKAQLGALIPRTAVDMLYERLSGRFRPIATAIEGIIKTGRLNAWETTINDTEIMLTSWKDRTRRGNLCGELNRLENKIANHPEHFTSCSSLRETLGVFLFRYCLLDAKEIVLEDEVQLVEAAFGRIKLFGGKARTVIDEPFVLVATFNYFRQVDPGLVSAVERAIRHSDNASVHGCMWEASMPRVFIETFKSRPFSSWPLLGNSSLPDQLKGDVTIVGYDDHQPKVAVSHRHLTTQQFMKAHVESGSRLCDQSIPPFYFPAPHVSGPDIVFYVKINEKLYPVFVQLKLQQVLEGSDVEKARATVSSHAMQKKLDSEHESLQKVQLKQQKQQQGSLGAAAYSGQQQPPRLQDYCPTGMYISMVITYPAEVVNFQIVRPNPAPELDGLQRVSIDIDGNNFPKIFPKRHVEELHYQRANSFSTPLTPIPQFTPSLPRLSSSSLHAYTL
ncbi:hypothetical protein BG004_002986 [Podila humilis]|nr:hypothetical protein BG004_002986 [Podila humilis]